MYPQRTTWAQLEIPQVKDHSQQHKHVCRSHCRKPWDDQALSWNMNYVYTKNHVIQLSSRTWKWDPGYKAGNKIEG